MTPLRQALWARLTSPWWAGLLAAAVVVGCGGGGESTASGGVGVGGTGAGPVTGYGSLIVNNTRFGIDDATFAEDDGSAFDPGDRVRPVGLGAIVDIRSGEITRNSDDDDVARATLVTVISAIKGPVEVAPSGDTLTVLGHVIRVNSATKYGTDAGNGLSDLAVNTQVVVYGYQDATGAYLATRIEEASGPLLVYKVRGRVSRIIDANHFVLGAVNGAGGITVETNGLRRPDAGDLVSVRLNTQRISAGTYALAATPTVVDRTPPEAARNGLEGIVSEFVSNEAPFLVDGIRVRVTASTPITGELGNNRRVGVEGVVVNRTLVATKLVVREIDGGDLLDKERLIDRVRTLDMDAKTFTLRGVQVRYTVSTRIEGCGRNVCVAADLQNEPLVEAEGRELPSGLFIATKIKLRRTNNG